VRVHGRDATILSTLVALPDASTLLAGYDSVGPLVAKLRRDGSIDRSFGKGGVVHVARRDGLSARQILPLPDGRAIVVVAAKPPAHADCARVLIVRLTAKGALDQSFGRAGTADPGLVAFCGFSSIAALAADGAIVLSGVRETAASGSAARTLVVARLSPHGEVDSRFANGGFATIGKLLSLGSSTTALGAGGRVLVAFDTASGAQVIALTATGATDASLNAGAPLMLSEHGVEMVVQPSGAIDLHQPTLGLVRRFTPSGTPDDAFGTRGTAALSHSGYSEYIAMVPAADGGVLVMSGNRAFDLGPRGATIQHLTAAGHPLRPVRLSPSFGGGYFAGVRVDDGFVVSDVIQRSDGSYLLGGVVNVAGPTEAGVKVYASGLAVAAYRPDLTLDPSFGGPRRARMTVRLSRPLAADGSVRVRVTSSAPGIAELVIRDDHRRLLARRTLKIRGRETTTVRLLLLRGAPTGLHAVIGFDFRDVASGRARGTVPIRL
jgi:uncharacterized delta-60 repeat protein